MKTQSARRMKWLKDLYRTAEGEERRKAIFQEIAELEAIEGKQKMIRSCEYLIPALQSIIDNRN